MLSSVGDYLVRQGATDGAAYRRLTADQETHFLLKEKIAGLPQVDAVTMIDAGGKLINFSRYWPIPDVNISDRDYYKALKADRNLESFISTPVQNRGSGTWNIYIARRLNDPNGEFMGRRSARCRCNISKPPAPLHSGSTTGFPGSRRRYAACALSTYRRDRQAVLGRRTTRTCCRRDHSRDPRARDNHATLRAARMLPNYPALVVVSQTEESVLRGWRAMATLLSVMSLISTIVVPVAASMIARWWTWYDT